MTFQTQPLKHTVYLVTFTSELTYLFFCGINLFCFRTISRLIHFYSTAHSKRNILRYSSHKRNFYSTAHSKKRLLQYSLQQKQQQINSTAQNKTKLLQYSSQHGFLFSTVGTSFRIISNHQFNVTLDILLIFIRNNTGLCKEKHVVGLRC